MKMIKSILLLAAFALAVEQTDAQIPPLTAITNVYTGTGQNTGTGDTAYLAFAKVNTNTVILSNAVAGVQSLLQVVIPSGSGASTIQAVFNSMTNGGFVRLACGVYNITNNVLITNSMVLDLSGVTLTAAPGLTNAMFDTGTNYGKSLLVKGGTFDGGVYSAYDSSSYFTEYNGSYDPYYNPRWTNCTGLRVECSGGVIISGTTFKGWPGNGLLVINDNTTTPQLLPKSGAVNCTFTTNFVGAFAVGESYDVPGYYNAPSGQFLTADAQFFTFNGCSANECQIGIAACGANDAVLNCDLAGNYAGLFVGSGNDNGGHGTIVGNDFDHCTYATWYESSQGGIYSNNRMLGSSQLVFSGVSLVSVKNCNLGSTSLYFTNGCTGQFSDNVFDAGDVWGVNIATNFSPGMIVSRNFDATGSNSDGSPESLAVKKGILNQFTVQFPITSSYQLGGTYSGSTIQWGAPGAASSVAIIAIDLKPQANPVYFPWDSLQSFQSLGLTNFIMRVGVYSTNTFTAQLPSFFGYSIVTNNPSGADGFWPYGNYNPGSGIGYTNLSANLVAGHVTQFSVPFSLPPSILANMTTSCFFVFYNSWPATNFWVQSVNLTAF